MKQEVQVVKQELAVHDRRIQNNHERIETNEGNARKYNVRIYGFDFTKSRNRDQQGNLKTVQPDQLVKETLQKGFHLDQTTIEDMKMAACHWVTKTNKPYIIVRFQNMKCTKLLDNRKKDIYKNYMPHGQRIFIRDDLTKVNLLYVYAVFISFVAKMVQTGTKKLQIQIKCYIPVSSVGLGY